MDKDKNNADLKQQVNTFETEQNMDTPYITEKEVDSDADQDPEE